MDTKIKMKKPPLKYSSETDISHRLSGVYSCWFYISALHFSLSWKRHSVPNSYHLQNFLYFVPGYHSYSNLLTSVISEAAMQNPHKCSWEERMGTDWLGRYCTDTVYCLAVHCRTTAQITPLNGKTKSFLLTLISLYAYIHKNSKVVFSRKHWI